MLGLRKKPQTGLPNISLTGFRVRLRPPQRLDWFAWADVRGRNKKFLKPYEPSWAENCLNEDFFERRMARQIIDWEMERGRAFLIFKNEGDLIGGMNINNICRGAAQYASLGYWLDEAHQGQGYMAEAMRLTMQYCFEILDFHRINAACIPDNVRSKNLLLKAGFEEEGFAKNYLQIDGCWQDHILFGLPIERWIALQTA